MKGNICSVSKKETYKHYISALKPAEDWMVKPGGGEGNTIPKKEKNSSNTLSKRSREDKHSTFACRVCKQALKHRLWHLQLLPTSGLCTTQKMGIAKDGVVAGDFGGCLCSPAFTNCIRRLQSCAGEQIKSFQRAACQVEGTTLYYNSAKRQD